MTKPLSRQNAQDIVDAYWAAYVGDNLLWPVARDYGPDKGWRVRVEINGLPEVCFVVTTVQAMMAVAQAAACLMRTADSLPPGAVPVQARADVLGGEPCFAGTRVPVKTLFSYLEAGDPLGTFLRHYPGVTAAQVQAFFAALARGEKPW